MEQRVYQGYTITDSVHIGNAEFVIGEKETCAGTIYVTWRNRGDDFISGHYFDQRHAAESDLLARTAWELNEQKQRNSLEDFPIIGPESYSPWGNVTRWEMHCPGVYTVTTAIHGGVEVAAEMAHKYFSSAALECSLFENGYYWFEENHTIAVAYRELMDKGLLVLTKDIDPNKLERDTNRCIKKYFPDYWRARKKMLAQKDRTTPARPAIPRRKERER